LIDKTGQFVVKHDFDELSWTDSRYIGKRGTALYQLDGKGGEIQLPANASQESSWVKTELEAAREHDISLPFYYPRLNTGGQAVSKGAAECLRGSGSGLFRLRE